MFQNKHNDRGSILLTVIISLSILSTITLGILAIVESSNRYINANYIGAQIKEDIYSSIDILSENINTSIKSLDKDIENKDFKKFILLNIEKITKESTSLISRYISGINIKINDKEERKDGIQVQYLISIKRKNIDKNVSVKLLINTKGAHVYDYKEV